MSKPIGKPIIGAFVVGAVAIVVTGLFVLGGGKFLEKKFVRVMYFDRSVKGLRVGAPVTFQGVKVGTVSSIAIRANTEDLTTRIPVVVEINPASIETTSGQLDNQLSRLIEKGLRARLELQSLVTGQLQIELDFMPGTEARLVGGQTKYAEIPTVPSTLSKFAKELQKIPLPEIGQRVSTVLASIETPIKHIYRKNQRIFGVELANHLILLIPKFPDANEVKKIWCGNYLVKFKIVLDLYDNYANLIW